MKQKICEWIFINIIPNYFLFGTDNKWLNAIWLWFAKNGYDDGFTGMYGSDSPARDALEEAK